jgi:hypothetical protein
MLSAVQSSPGELSMCSHVYIRDRLTRIDLAGNAVIDRPW